MAGGDRGAGEGCLTTPSPFRGRGAQAEGLGGGIGIVQSGDRQIRCKLGRVGIRHLLIIAHIFGLRESGGRSRCREADRQIAPPGRQANESAGKSLRSGRYAKFPADRPKAIGCVARPDHLARSLLRSGSSDRRRLTSFENDCPFSDLPWSAVRSRDDVDVA